MLAKPVAKDTTEETMERYEPPRLVPLGNVRDIIAGGTSGMDDGKSGRGKF